MRSRAAILPFPGDPFLLHYWLKFYDEIWGKEIDKLYVFHNSSIQPEVELYIKELVVKRNGVYLYEPRSVEHGQGIKKLLEACKEEYVMLAEDDGFIFGKDQVNMCFELLETDKCDLVGGRRHSCSPKISELAEAKWNLLPTYPLIGDQGPNFWPCYLFAKKDLLMDTDQHFGPYTWYKGERIEPLDYTVEEELLVGDTFVNTSLQLRNKGLRVHCEPHYHGSPDDIAHHRKRFNLWDGQAKWTHAGSLSSGIGGMLVDDEGRRLSGRMNPPITPKEYGRIGPNTDAERREWERRVQWWLTAWENRDPEAIPEFADLYKKALDKLIGTFSLSMNNIVLRQKIYKEIGL